MKTYEEFRREIMADIKRAEEMSLAPKEYSYAQIETMAAKEYANQARNKAIQDCIDIVAVTPGDENVIPKLKSMMQ